MKISIVTVCFNAEDSIKETILSVLGQDYNNIEFIVVDGKSQDHTYDIVQKYAKNFNKISRNMITKSERDSGIYNAMNKAVKMANGEYVLFLNAGDVLVDKNTLTSIINNMDFDSDVIYGNHYARNRDKVRLVKPKDLSYIHIDSVFCHQASLIRTELLKQTPYDETYKLLADYDFFVKLYLSNYKFKYIDIAFAFYNLSGVSQKQLDVVISENISIREKYNFISGKQIKKEILKKEYQRIRKTLIDKLPFCIRTIRYFNLKKRWDEYEY